MNRNLPTLKQLKYFIALSETLNFTQAAERCFVGQSTLSTGLKELEDTLGVQLVERDRQKVSLTPVGFEVLERARSILSSGEDLLDYIQESAGVTKGYVRLGVIPTIAPFVLPKLLPLLRKTYPELKVLLREDLTQHLLHKVRNYELDFALIALPFDTNGLLVKEIFDDEFWLIGPVNHPALKNPDVRMTHQMTDQILLLEEGHCLRDHTLMACKKTEINQEHGAEATSLLTLVQMVESEIGLALLPEMAIKAGILKHTNLIARPLLPPSPRRKIALIARTSTARIEVFNQIAQLIKNHR
jgi:LysR family hydrogen peroxide-inducible transcriptional activator